MRTSGAALAVVAMLSVAGCSNNSSSSNTSTPVPPTRLTSQPFGTSPDGQPIDVVTLSNLKGMEVRVMTYGGIVVSVKAPDKDGHADDVVLGHDDAAGYFDNSPYFGAIIGR